MIDHVARDYDRSKSYKVEVVCHQAE